MDFIKQLFTPYAIQTCLTILIYSIVYFIFFGCAFFIAYAIKKIIRLLKKKMAKSRYGIIVNVYHKKNKTGEVTCHADFLVIMKNHITNIHSGILLSNQHICTAGLFIKTYWAFNDIHHFKVISADKIPSIYKEELIEEFEEFTKGHYNMFEPGRR